MQSVMRGCGRAERCLEEGLRGDRIERDGLQIEKKGSSNGRAGDEEAEKKVNQLDGSGHCVQERLERPTRVDSALKPKSMSSRSQRTTERVARKGKERLEKWHRHR